MQDTHVYTSINGKQLALTPKVWRNIRRVACNRFDGSTRLFNACWRQYRQWLNGAIDDPINLDDVMQWLDTIASEKVNNPASSFYIHG